jgi:hypothetical protein
VRAGDGAGEGIITMQPRRRSRSSNCGLSRVTPP